MPVTPLFSFHDMFTRNKKSEIFSRQAKGKAANQKIVISRGRQRERERATEIEAERDSVVKTDNKLQIEDTQRYA